MPSLSFTVNPKLAQITEIIRGLYICGVSSLTSENMQKYEISLIINATKEVPNIRALGNIPRIKLWLEDTPQTSIYPVLDLQSDQIEAVLAGGGNVLVHSVAGISRSAAVCLAFLTKFRCKSLREAYYLMAEKRSLVRPNTGFWRQLIAYEQDVKQTIATVHLIKDKIDPEHIIPDVYVNKESEAHGAALSKADAENAKEGSNRRQRHRNSGGKLKFQPVLEPLYERVEAAA